MHESQKINYRLLENCAGDAAGQMIKFKPKTLALLFIIFTSIVGAGNGVLTKIAVKEIPPFSFTFFRFLFAAICMLPLFLKNRPIFHRDLYKVVIFSILLSLNVILFPIGVALTTATIAATLYVFAPVIIAIISYFLLHERFAKQKIIGIFLGFIGTLIIILLPVLSKGSPFSGSIAGNLIIFVGVVGTALYTVLSKPFQTHYSPQQLTSVLIFTTLILLIFPALSDVYTHPLWWQNISTFSIWSTIYVGTLGTVGWYLIYQYAIKNGSPLIASLTLYLQPFFVFLLANFLLGELLTIGFVIGAILSFAGVYLVSNSKR